MLFQINREGLSGQTIVIRDDARCPTFRTSVQLLIIIDSAASMLLGGEQSVGGIC